MRGCEVESQIIASVLTTLDQRRGSQKLPNLCSTQDTCVCARTLCESVMCVFHFFCSQFSLIGPRRQEMKPTRVDRKDAPIEQKYRYKSVSSDSIRSTTAMQFLAFFLPFSEHHQQKRICMMSVQINRQTTRHEISNGNSGHFLAPSNNGRWQLQAVRRGPRSSDGLAPGLSSGSRPGRSRAFRWRDRRDGGFCFLAVAGKGPFLEGRGYESVRPLRPIGRSVLCAERIMSGRSVFRIS